MGYGALISGQNDTLEVVTECYTQIVSMIKINCDALELRFKDI